MDLAEIAALTEDQARDYLEGLRWPNGPVCPHCGVEGNAHKMTGKSTRPGTYKCRDCRKPFTVTVGTIFHGSRLGLRKWLMAFHLVCSSKKGISALQLKRNLGLGSYQTAWHMAHRIRHAMRSDPLRGMLKGTVEADETFIGGKPRNPSKKNQGTYRDRKAAVMVLVERDGEARTMHVERLTGETVRDAIRENVDTSGRLMTDEARHYLVIGREFDGGHQSTKHSLGEYVRGDVHSNTAESFFAILKRGVHGVFHHVSKRHLHRYLDEFEFRWNTRKTDDGTRTAKALQGTGGKRLTYKPLVRPSEG